jgi:Domain of unknown function (DUF4770)/Domain of unknown function (DUF4771)
MPRANPFLTHEEETYFRHYSHEPATTKPPQVQMIEIKIIDENPKWYQELSNEQITAADQLFEAIRIDCEENSVNRTKGLLNRLGLCPLVCDKVLSTLVCLSRGSDVAFLWLLFDLVYKTDTTFSLNERILLSCLCHLDMAVTLSALDRALPLPEMAHRRIPRNRIMAGKRKYISPYLEPNPVPRRSKQKSSVALTGPNQHPDFERYSSSKNGDANRWLSIKPDEVENEEVNDCEEESENSEEQSETKIDCEEWPRICPESKILDQTKPHQSLYDECRKIQELTADLPALCQQQNVMPTFEGTIGSCLQNIYEDDTSTASGDTTESETCVLDPCDNRQMTWLLKKGLKIIGEENAMLIVPFLPESHKLPLLREWIRARYGFHHTQVTRKEALNKSRRQWNVLHAKERKSLVVTPKVKDIHCGCVADWNLKKRLTGKVRFWFNFVICTLSAVGSVSQAHVHGPQEY